MAVSQGDKGKHVKDSIFDFFLTLQSLILVGKHFENLIPSSHRTPFHNYVTTHVLGISSPNLVVIQQLLTEKNSHRVKQNLDLVIFH